MLRGPRRLLDSQSWLSQLEIEKPVGKIDAEGNALEVFALDGDRRKKRTLTPSTIGRPRRTWVAHATNKTDRGPTHRDKRQLGARTSTATDAHDPSGARASRAEEEPLPRGPEGHSSPSRGAGHHTVRKASKGCSGLSGHRDFGQMDERPSCAWKLHASTCHPSLLRSVHGLGARRGEHLGSVRVRPLEVQTLVATGKRCSEEPYEGRRMKRKPFETLPR